MVRTDANTNPHRRAEKVQMSATTLRVAPIRTCPAPAAGTDLLGEEKQRTKAVKRRKEIWEALHPSEKGGKTVSTLGGNQQVGFASDTASSAGMTKQAINRHLARAEALGDDLDKGPQ